jgi:hypothetical protein
MLTDPIPLVEECITEGLPGSLCVPVEIFPLLFPGSPQRFHNVAFFPIVSIANPMKLI